MKTRRVVIHTGERFEVPQGIQRIDHRATHGWQLRYGGTKLFSDGSPDGSGASEALAHATRELLALYADPGRAASSSPGRWSAVPMAPPQVVLPDPVGPVTRIIPSCLLSAFWSCSYHFHRNPISSNVEVE